MRRPAGAGPAPRSDSVSVSLSRRTALHRGALGALGAVVSSRLPAGTAFGAQPDGFRWDEVSADLHRRFRDPRRHFVFEYYSWYASEPVLHWDQWDRQPPHDLAANTVPRLGAYDSTSTAVLEQHARWILESGAGVINLTWWGRGHYTDLAVHPIMDVMAAHDIQVMFHLEPYGPRRGERFADDVLYLLEEYGERRRWDCLYLNEREDGRSGPVFKGFNTLLPRWRVDCRGMLAEIDHHVPWDVWRRSIDQLRATVAADFPTLTLLSDSWAAEDVRAAGFDGLAPYGPFIDRSEWLGIAVGARRTGLSAAFSVNPGADVIVQRRPSDPCYQPQPFLPRPDDGPLDWSSPSDRERAARLAERQIDETLQWALELQTDPWLTDTGQGFFLVFLCSFNEWHEGHQFEPMKDAAALTRGERALGYHNPEDGAYRLRHLADRLARVV